MRMSSRWLIASGCLGTAALLWLLLWGFENTSPPNMGLQVALLLIIVWLAVGPWAVLVIRKLEGDREASQLFRRVVLVATLIAAGGFASAMALAGEQIAGPVAMLSILVAGALALVGAAVLPWLFLLTRTVARERAARIRAEERAQLAAHLHDSVLQALMLIQKRTEDPGLLQLARRTERELRAWLYGGPTPGEDDFASAVRAMAAEVEDEYAVVVELITVGTCPLDGRSRAVVGAVREAMTNAAKHADVRRVSVYAEVAEAEVFALIRDRGRGFDPATRSAQDRRGIADSIKGRVQQQGGLAAVRSTPGEGTEVELRMPIAGHL
jgi:signal transduction histidine kinase